MLPADNVWNKRVDALPVAADSARLIEGIGLGDTLHPDFSDQGRYGIPVNVVTTTTPRSRVRFDYADESDRVRYPIPARPRIEGGGDRHMLMIDRDACRLYELFAAQRTPSGWSAGSGAVFDLRSNRLRPAGWTSADAAGLPILPGLARFDEVRARRHRPRAALHGAEHAEGLRLPGPPRRLEQLRSRPAAHGAARAAEGVGPAGGLRPPGPRRADRPKRYGMILADNGSPWYVSGAPAAGLGRRRPARPRAHQRQRLRGRGHPGPAERPLSPDRRVRLQRKVTSSQGFSR